MNTLNQQTDRHLPHCQHPATSSLLSWLGMRNAMTRWKLDVTWRCHSSVFPAGGYGYATRSRQISQKQMRKPGFHRRELMKGGGGGVEYEGGGGYIPNSLENQYS